MKNDHKPVSLRREFGIVARHPDIHNGQPFLNHPKSEKNTAVQAILDLIKQGYSDKYICKTMGISKKDIDVCISYQARFMTDDLPPHLAHIDENKKIFMLDENISYAHLHHVAELFGWSSHVYADGLRGKDDEKDIWAHAIRHGYKAILTADDDFIDIALRHRQKLIDRYGSIEQNPQKPPAVIFIKSTAARNKIRSVLEQHYNNIAKYIRNNNAAYAIIDGGKFDRAPRDSKLKKNSRSDRLGRPNSP